MTPIAPTVYTDFSSALGAAWSAHGVSIVGGKLTGTGTLRTTADLPADVLGIATWDAASAGSIQLGLRNSATGTPSDVGDCMVLLLSLEGGFYTTVRVLDNTAGGFTPERLSLIAVEPVAAANTYFLATGVAWRLVGSAGGGTATLEIALRNPSGQWVWRYTASNHGRFSRTVGNFAGRKAAIRLDGLSLTSFGLYPSDAWLVPHTGYHPETLADSSPGVRDTLNRDAYTTQTLQQIVDIDGHCVGPNLTKWPQTTGTDGSVGVKLDSPVDPTQYSLRIVPNKQWTLQWWMRPSGGTLSENAHIIKCSNGLTSSLLQWSSGLKIAYTNSVQSSSTLHAASVPDLPDGEWAQFLWVNTGTTQELYMNNILVAVWTGMETTPETFYPVALDGRVGISLLGGGGQQVWSTKLEIAGMRVLSGEYRPISGITNGDTGLVTITDTPANEIPQLAVLHLTGTSLPTSALAIEALAEVGGTTKVCRTDKFVASVDYGTASASRTYKAASATGYINPAILDRLIFLADAAGIGTLWLAPDSCPQHVGGSTPPLSTAAAATWYPGSDGFDPAVPNDYDDWIDHMKSVVKYLEDNYSGEIIWSTCNEPGCAPGDAFFIGTVNELTDLYYRFYEECVVPVQGATPKFGFGETPHWQTSSRDLINSFLTKFDAEGLTTAQWNNLWPCVHFYDGSYSIGAYMQSDVDAMCTALSRPTRPLTFTESSTASHAAQSNVTYPATLSGRDTTDSGGVADWVNALQVCQRINGLPGAITGLPIGLVDFDYGLYEYSSWIRDDGTRKPITHLVEFLSRMARSNAVAVNSGVQVVSGLASDNAGALALALGNSSWYDQTIDLAWVAAAGYSFVSYTISPSSNTGETLTEDASSVVFDGSGETTVTIPARSAIFLEGSGSVVETVTASTSAIQIVPGGRVPLFATVLLDTLAPASGRTVSASLSPTVSGLSIASTVTTDSEGIGLFTDDDGLRCTSAVPTGAGSNTTLTLTCSGITAEIAVEVVASISGGGGEEIMQVDDTNVVETTGAWSAGLAGSISIDLQPLEGDLYYQVGTAPPAAGAKGKFVRSANSKAVSVPTGKTLYWRSKEAAGTLAYDIKNS
jgi:hypothetical protein